jgi:hypothetical protein
LRFYFKKDFAKPYLPQKQWAIIILTFSPTIVAGCKHWWIVIWKIVLTSEISLVGNLVAQVLRLVLVNRTASFTSQLALHWCYDILGCFSLQWDWTCQQRRWYLQLCGNGMVIATAGCHQESIFRFLSWSLLSYHSAYCESCMEVEWLAVQVRKYSRYYAMLHSFLQFSSSRLIYSCAWSLMRCPIT